MIWKSLIALSLLSSTSLAATGKDPQENIPRAELYKAPSSPAPQSNQVAPLCYQSIVQIGLTRGQAIHWGLLGGVISVASMVAGFYTYQILAKSYTNAPKTSAIWVAPSTARPRPIASSTKQSPKASSSAAQPYYYSKFSITKNPTTIYRKDGTRTYSSSGLKVTHSKKDGSQSQLKDDEITPWVYQWKNQIVPVTRQDTEELERQLDKIEKPNPNETEDLKPK